jgi:hypothetical protein
VPHQQCSIPDLVLFSLSSEFFLLTKKNVKILLKPTKIILPRTFLYCFFFKFDEFHHLLLHLINVRIRKQDPDTYIPLYYESEDPEMFSNYFFSPIRIPNRIRIHSSKLRIRESGTDIKSSGFDRRIEIETCWDQAGEQLKQEPS